MQTGIVAKNFANNDLDKAPDVIYSLSKVTNNKTIKVFAALIKGTRNLRKKIRNWDTLYVF